VEARGDQGYAWVVVRRTKRGETRMNKRREVARQGEVSVWGLGIALAGLWPIGISQMGVYLFSFLNLF
jgi:hypothetical protein